MAQNDLVVAMSGLAKRAIEGDAIASAGASADTIMSTRTAPKSESQVVMLVDAAKLVRVGRLALEKQAESITDPLNAALKAVRNLVGPHVAKLKAAEDYAKRLKGQYDSNLEAERQRAQREQQARLDAAAQTAALPDEPPPPAAVAYAPPPPNKVTGGIGGMHGRKVARVRVTDRAALMKAHPHLFVLDERAALALAQESLPAAVVGLELYYETTQVLS